MECIKFVYKIYLTYSQVKKTTKMSYEVGCTITKLLLIQVGQIYLST